MYRYEDMRKGLESSIKWYDDRIKLWEAVKFPRKKDGTPFKVLSKNFDGAKIGAYYPVERWDNPYLTVRGYVGGEWADDHIPIYMDKYNERLPKHNDEREVRRSEFGYDVEVLTLEEIGSEIRHRIEDFGRHKAEAERALMVSEEKYNEVQSKLSEIRDIICSDDTPETLRYSLRDQVEKSGYFLRHGW